jgi:hypothetical protein
VKTIFVWFVPDAQRPWRVFDGGITYVCRSVSAEGAETEFRDEGFLDLPGSPRGVLRAAKVSMFDSEVFQTRAAI